MRLVAAIRGAANGLMAQVMEEHIRFHIADPAHDPDAERAEAPTNSSKSSTAISSDQRMEHYGGRPSEGGSSPAGRGSESFAHEFLVRERTLDFSRVEESDAALDGRLNQRDRLLLVDGRTVAIAQARAASPMAETSRPLSLRFYIVAPSRVALVTQI
jgi:hypothetical protein